MLLNVSMVEWAKRLLTVCGVAVGVASIALGLLVTFQEKLIYIPRIPGMPAMEYDDPRDYNIEAEVVKFTAKDGTRISGWFMHPKGWTAKQKRQHPTIIFLQENAGTMAMRLSFFVEMLRYLHCSVLAPSYRGYRLNSKIGSTGAPNESGLKQDAQAALDYLLSRPDVNPQQISVMGKSLGGASAIHLAAANPGKIRSLVVENTFTSIEDVAHKVLPPLKYVIGRNKPLNFLVRNKWRNHEAIAQSFIRDTPTLLLSSLQDEMLPPEQMRELYTIAKNAGAKNITWIDFAEAHHMDAYVVAHNYWPAVIHFYRSHHSSIPNSSDSEDSTGGFEDVGSDSAVQEMLRAVRGGGDVGASAEGVRVRHHEQKP